MNLLLFVPMFASICEQLEYSARIKQFPHKKYSKTEKSIKKYFNSFAIVCGILGILSVL